MNHAHNQKVCFKYSHYPVVCYGSFMLGSRYDYVICIVLLHVHAYVYRTYSVSISAHGTYCFGCGAEWGFTYIEAQTTPSVQLVISAESAWRCTPCSCSLLTVYFYEVVPPHLLQCDSLPKHKTPFDVTITSVPLVVAVQFWLINE